MFQFTYFNKKIYNKTATKIDKGEINLPSDFIGLYQIESVRTLYWEEHCLECSPPHCYNNCNYYQRRKDNSCVRLSYGIKRNNIKNALWGAEIKFRPWAKLEARINKGGQTVNDIIKLDKWDKSYTKSHNFLSKISSFAIKNYKFTQRAEGVKRKRYAQIENSGKLEDTFLFQCYSKSQKEFNLCLETTTRDNVVQYRKKIQIQPKFNQAVIKIEAPLIEGGLIRIYPENDYQAEMIIFACDIVKLKGSEVPTQPANKVKCVAWDLDCTIWKGILVESNPDQLELRQGILQVIKDLDERGIIQIIVSKNDEKFALPQLQRLNIEDYFVYKFINWAPKSSNLSLAANLLNINIDTFAFIDDSIFERKEVNSVLPCVRCYTEDEALNLFNRKEFDVTITQESKERRKMYQTEAKRKQISTQYSGDNLAFLRDCQIKLVIKKLSSAEEKKRSFDLIHRTNQLNLSGKKYTQEEFEKIISLDNNQNYIAECFDKFGNYGQVAYFLFKDKENDIIIKEFAMSCRVANKYVESALINWLQKKYNQGVILQGVKTQRNGLLLETFKKIGFIDSSTQNDILLKIDKNSICNNFDVVEVEAYD